MLVEDDISMLTVLRTLLEIEDYEVSVAPLNATSTGLLDCIRQTQPGVILLDVHLRQANGLDVLRGIREDEQMRPIRVVMSSGLDVGDACLCGGADSFLMKPYMPDELLKKLRG
jgi:DNA-binding response OmpR family regulator